MKILLVDDHKLMLEGLTNLLIAHGIDVVGTASDGEQAVTRARDLRPDVILMDIRMPRMDGLTATRLIRAEIPDAKILILTTSTAEEDLFEAVKSGAFGYLLKTIDADELVEALEEAQQGIPPFSPGLAARLLKEFMRQLTPPPAAPVQMEETSAPAPRIEQEAPAMKQVPVRLTQRQREVLMLIAQGMTYKEVGTRMGLSPRTVKYHMVEIMEQLHLENRAQVIAYAARLENRP